MKNMMSLQTGVFINYKSLIIMIILVVIGEVKGWNWLLVGSEILFFILFIATFIQTQIKTGLWSFAHKKVEDLDEREHEISYEALRHSYSVFTIATSLLLLFLWGIVDASSDHGIKWSVLLMAVLYLSFNYFAHTLPAAVLIWKSRKVFYEE